MYFRYKCLYIAINLPWPDLQLLLVEMSAGEPIASFSKSHCLLARALCRDELVASNQTSDEAQVVFIMST